MKRFIISIAVAVFITFSIVSVAYPRCPKQGSQLKLCVSCWPELICGWDDCGTTWEQMVLCHIYNAIVPFNGGCCDHRSCTYYVDKNGNIVK